MPVWSRRSTKIRPPWSRRRATQPASVRRSPTWSLRTSPAPRSRQLMGQPLALEQGRGTRGNREVPPHLWRRGLAGETGFPPRERAEGERRSFSHHRDEPLAELLQEGGRVTPARELFAAQDLDRQLTR